MMTFREFVEYLEELSQQVKDNAASKLLDKAEQKRTLSKQIYDKMGKWDKATRKVVDKLDHESRKHANTAAKIITGK